MAVQFIFTVGCATALLLFQEVLPQPIVQAAASQNGPDCRFLPDESSPTEQCGSFWGGQKPPVLLISMDGFRPEYFNRTKLDGSGGLAAPTLNCLRKRGVAPPYMMPSYPTSTFPNHYSIATGLYPESHQIVSNEFFDPQLNAQFSVADRDPKWWRNGEPIWTTIRKQGKVSATYFWPGSSVEHPSEEKRSPNFYFNYNASVPFRARVDQVLEWMDLAVGKRPSLVTLYFDEPDRMGHQAGPNTPDVTEAIALTDNAVRRLVDGLVGRSILTCVNLIIVSDHGMADLPVNNTVQLAKHVPGLDQSALVYYGPVTYIRPNNSNSEEEKRIANALACRDPHLRVYRKSELPYRMHSSRSPRIPTIVVDLDLSWRGVFAEESSHKNKGSHGWDNMYQDLQAVFVAHGPSFKRAVVVRPFQNIEVYNLICALLEVTPSENNGTYGALHHLLADPPSAESSYGEGEQSVYTPLRGSANLESGEQDSCHFLRNASNSPSPSREDVLLNMDREREHHYQHLHCPLGNPIPMTREHQSPSVPATLALLTNEDYITGFDVEHGAPLWTAYTIGHDITKSDGHVSNWVEDVRLHSNHAGGCKRLKNRTGKADAETYLANLYPKEFASRHADAWLDTNLLELPAHMHHLVGSMNQLLTKSATVHGLISVVSGPARRNFPALFYIVTTCKSVKSAVNITNCRLDDRDVQAFLLPIGQRLNGDCQSDEEFIQLNVATLKDVERVTDLSFFPHLPADEKRMLLSRVALDSQLVVNPVRRAQQIVFAAVDQNGQSSASHTRPLFAFYVSVAIAGYVQAAV